MSVCSCLSVCLSVLVLSVLSCRGLFVAFVLVLSVLSLSAGVLAAAAFGVLSGAWFGGRSVRGACLFGSSLLAACVCSCSCLLLRACCWVLAGQPPLYHIPVLNTCLESAGLEVPCLHGNEM